MVELYGRWPHMWAAEFLVEGEDVTPHGGHEERVDECLSGRLWEGRSNRSAPVDDSTFKKKSDIVVSYFLTITKCTLIFVH